MKTTKCCITSFCTSMNKYLAQKKKNQEKSCLLWLSVSEGSAHSCLATCLQQNIMAAKACGRGQLFTCRPGSTETEPGSGQR